MGLNLKYWLKDKVMIKNWVQISIIFILLCLTCQAGFTQEKYKLTCRWGTSNFYSDMYTISIKDNNRNVIYAPPVFRGGNMDASEFTTTITTLPMYLSGTVKVVHYSGNPSVTFSQKYTVSRPCFNVSLDISSKTYSYNGQTYIDEGPGVLYVKEIKPFYEIQSLKSIACIGDPIELELTNSKIFCGYIILKVRKSGTSSWSNDIRKTVSSKYLDISYEDVSSYINPNEGFDVCVVWPDGKTTANRCLNDLYFIPKPSFTISFVSPECHGDEATLKLTGLSVFEEGKAKLIVTVNNSTINEFERFELTSLSSDNININSYVGFEITDGEYHVEVFFDDGVSSGILCKATADETIVTPDELVISNLVLNTLEATNGKYYHTTEIGGTASGTITITGRNDNVYTIAQPAAGGTLEHISGNEYKISGFRAREAIQIKYGNCTSNEINVPVLSEPADLLVSTLDDIVHFDCAEGKKGSVNYNFSGGFGPYKVELIRKNGSVVKDKEINETPLSGTFVSLEAGLYTIKVIDLAIEPLATAEESAGVSDEFEIGINALSFDQIIPTEPNCHEGADGAIELIATGGTSPYNYFIDDWDTALSDNIKSDLTEGTYGCKVVDKYGCSYINENVELKEPAVLSLEIGSKTFETCENAGDGSIELTLHGGHDTDTDRIRANYSGTSSGSVWSTFDERNFILKGLHNGTYNIFVTNSKECEYAKEVAVSVLLNPNPFKIVTVDTKPASCDAIDNGELKINLVNGSPLENNTYTLELDGKAGTSYSYGTYINQLDGNIKHNIIVTDKNSCTANLTGIDIGIDMEQLKVLAPIVNSPGCNDENIGEIILQGVKGKADADTPTETYKYSLDDVTYISTNKFENLEPKTYSAYVKDQAGCIVKVDNLTIEPRTDPISFNLTAIDESCETADNGIIQITNLIHSDKLDVTYHPLEPSDIEHVTAGYLGVDAGSYNVTISDDNGCSTTKSVIVGNSGESPTISNTIDTKLACESASNGAIDVDVSAVISYGLYDSNDKKINGESIDDTKFTGLDSQEYYFLATDANNCSSTLPITIPVSENAVKFTNEEWIPATCINASNGIINVEASEGVPDTFGYTFTFNGQIKQAYTAQFIGLAVGTSGVVTVTDATGCTAETALQTVVVREKVLQITAVDKTDPVCFGANSGEIRLTVENAIGTLTYSIEKRNESNVYVPITSTYDVGSNAYKNLDFGVYKVIVNDEDACNIFYEGIELFNPEKAEVTESNYNYIKVKGELTGEYEITLTGKNKYFTYGLKDITFGEPGVVIESGNLFYDSGYEIKKKFESLAAGKYRFTLTDDNACLDFNGSDTFTEEFSIKEPEFELSYTDELLTYVSCNGLSDGAISISGFGGWGEYSYSLNGGLWQNNGSFSNIVAGNYSIEIRDREETIITHLITITEPDVFSLAIDKYKDATCPAYANGQVLASSTNGIPFSEGLHYWIENTDDRSIILGDSHSGNSYVFKELPKGNYELFVSDSHNCSDKRSFSIEEPEPAVIEYTNNYIKAKGDASGEISMSITGGNGLFDYECLLNDEIIAFESGQTTEAIQLNNLLAGTYHILVRDTAACVYEAEEWMKRTIEIKEPELALGAEVKEKSEVSCYSLSDGLIAVDAVGGWGDYSYSLDGGAWQKDGTYSNLIVGDYSILIRDSVDISYLHEFIISEPDTLNLEIDLIKDATCPNYANGRVLATSLNGVPFGNGLHYWIENSDDNSIVLGDQFSDNSYQFKQLPEGNYELFVSDSHSCEASKTFSIKEPEPAKIELTHNYIKAKGDAAGEISLKLSGGNGTFDYECYLNNSSETYEQGQVKSEISLNNLLAGTYQIFVRDTAGCVYEEKEWMERIVEMREPDLALSFDIEEQRDVTCFGLTDGYLKLKAIGGWGDYRFQLNANPQTVSNEFLDLSAAVYQLQITDSVGISWAQEISIIEPNLLTAEYLSHKDVNCFGGNDGEITLKIEGGNPKYNLSLDEIDWITGSAMTELVKADYDIFVKDNKGCEVKVETVKIDQPDEITLLSSLVTKSRCSNNEGSIVTAFSGGVGQYTYQWNKDTLVNGAFVWKEILNSNSPAIDNLFSSQYIVKVRDEHLCELSFDFALGDITDLAIESIDVEDVSCWGYKDGKASALVKNGNSPYIYSWDVDITESNKDLAWDILAGTYNLLVRDDKGCAVSEKFTVGSPDPLSYQIDEIVQPLCYGGEKGVINLHAVGGTADYQYSWNDGRTASSIEELNPDLYSLTIKDAHNCESTFDFDMQYQRELKPFIGNDTLICHYNTLLLDGGDYSEYSWSSDFGFSSQKAQVDLTEPGKYYLEVTDEDQCLGFDTLSLDVSYFKIADMVSTDVTCNDFADGRAQIELTPLNWESKVVWPDGRNGLVWDKLSGGNYTVEVEDSYTCKDSHDFFIYEPDTLSVDVEKLLHPICSDVPNGEIELIANGGNGTYLFLWNNGSDKAKISDLDQGIYSVLIEDQKHCQISKSYDLKYQKTIQNDLGLDFLGPDTLICHYNSLPLDGRDFAKHYWTSDLGYSSSKRFVELNDPDNYYLQIEDEDKCFAYDTIKLSVSYLKIETLASTDVTCNSFADGNAQIAVLPANWKHVIEWSDGSHASTWNNLSGGDYQVQITDDYGCFDISKFSIYEPNELKIEVENLFHPLCFGVPDGFIRLNPLGGNGDYQFAWDHGSDKSRLTKLDQGDYSVLLTDKKGCQVSDNFTLEYQKAIYPDLGEDIIICSNNFVSLYPGNYSEYLWMEDNRILDNTESDLVVWDANEYSVEAKDEDGCTASDTINISVIESELNPVLLSASSVAVGDTLMVMDVSQPQPESLTWEFTGPHTITEQTGFYCLVVFLEEGMYEMKMSALLNDCVGELRESILVVPASEKADDGTETQSEAYVHLKKLLVSPNPSDGLFAADVELAESAEITFYLVNLQTGQVIEKRRRSGLKTYRENYSVSQSGSYCVYAESKGERKVVKLIVL